MVRQRTEKDAILRQLLTIAEMRGSFPDARTVREERQRLVDDTALPPARESKELDVFERRATGTRQESCLEEGFPSGKWYLGGSWSGHRYRAPCGLALLLHLHPLSF